MWGMAFLPAIACALSTAVMNRGNGSGAAVDAKGFVHALRKAGGEGTGEEE